MAEQDRPNQNANKSKAEGERPAENYPSGPDSDSGGITNRPLTEEVDNQQNLPDRGTHKDRSSDPASTRREGDYSKEER